MLRLNGIPARYVCPKDEGVRGAGATHAWVEAYIPFYGWLGLDAAMAPLSQGEGPGVRFRVRP
jgi:transglutaminase-like putative cysteine protease